MPKLGVIGTKNATKPKRRISASPDGANAIRCRNGLFLRVRLTRGQAIKAHCTECMGYEQNPAECPARHCALWAYRGKTRRTYDGNLTKEEAYG